MKSVVTSFSMSVSQANRIAESLKGVKNRSAYIVDAILKKINKDEAFEVHDVEYRSLLIALKNKDETPDHLKVLIQEELVK